MVQLSIDRNRERPTLRTIGRNTIPAAVSRRRDKGRFYRIAAPWSFRARSRVGQQVEKRGHRPDQYLITRLRVGGDFPFPATPTFSFQRPVRDQALFRRRASDATEEAATSTLGPFTLPAAIVFPTK